MKINYKSDFKIIERCTSADYVYSPFQYTYRVAKSIYVASFDGVSYSNCKRLDDGGIMVIFDNHNFPSGLLSVEREYFLTDKDFKDGICNVFQKESTGIELTSAQSDNSNIVEVSIIPNYQQGDSAYQVALSNGFKGTEEEWLESLCGLDGKIPEKGKDYFTAEEVEQVEREAAEKAIEAIKRAAQNLSDEQKADKRENIGAISSSELTSAINSAINDSWEGEY